MAGGIKNFQYVGYLSDFLTTHYTIDELTDKFTCAKHNYDNTQAATQIYTNTFSLKNCLIGWGIVFCFSLVSFPLLFLPGMTLIAWLIICAILSGVIILVSKIIYKKKVLPIHHRHLKIELSRAQRMYQTSYNALVLQRSNLNSMKEGLDEELTYPLSLYIMLKAAKEGECANIPQGIRYFRNRYKTLEKTEKEEFIKLKNDIDQEHARAAQQTVFLNNLDDFAKTLFEES